MVEIASLWRMLKKEEKEGREREKEEETEKEVKEMREKEIDNQYHAPSREISLLSWS